VETEQTRDFETDFAPLFDSPLQPVDVVENLSVAEFERRYRRHARPVIVDRAAAHWPALARWQDAAYLDQRAGHKTIFVRDLDAGSIDVGNYREEYRKTSFGDFASRVLSGTPAGYLTQALIVRGTGMNGLLKRSTVPAWLPELADDIELPACLPARALTEGNLWMGSGGQSSGLHYDEFNNLNVAIRGEKRWLLFPRSQTATLLSDGSSGRSSIARGFHAAQPARMAGRRAQARGYQCVTRPGQMLYVPAGMWHQVFSGPGPSMAVNFWYLQMPRDLHTCGVLHARRRTGFNSRRRFPLVLAILYLRTLLLMAQYALGKRAPEEEQVGATDYGF
jgi:hypothetical protein